MIVVGITDVEMNGTLKFEYDDDTSGWVIEDGDAVERVERWLEAFDGKRIEIKISLLDHNDDGVSIREKIYPKSDDEDDDE